MKVKKIILIVVFFLLIVVFSLMIVLGLTFSSSKKLFKGIVNNQPEVFDQNYHQVENYFSFWRIFLNKNKTFSLVNVFFESLPEVVGINRPKTYFVLLQNNMELRPTGGFMGSYAKIKLAKGGMGDLVVQDIYVPDGQIQGHVDPPAPIQTAFNQGWFRLRDSNWDPDFPTACQTISWFFDKGGEEKPNGIIGLNLILVSDLFEITGPLFLFDYNQSVDQQNFYQIAQQYSETDFFPGSSQKANIMGALVKAMITKIKTLNTKKSLLLLKVIYKNLKNNQILLYSTDLKLQTIFNQLGWDGSVKPLVLEQGQINDYFYLNEANLGANKANLYVTRQISKEVSFLHDSQIVGNRTTIVFTNASKYFTPVKPGFWGGDYYAYLRIYLPISILDLSVESGGEKLEEKDLTRERIEKQNLLQVGFWLKVPAKSEKKILVSFSLPLNGFDEKANYSLRVVKQPGIEKLPFSLQITKEKSTLFSLDQDLFRDQVIKSKI